MAIFGTTKKEGKKTAKAAPSRPVRDIRDAANRLAGVLERPWMSEKALIGTEKGVYVFEIPKEATKLDVKAAMEKQYKVVPLKIRVVNLPAKKVNLRARRGTGTKSIRRKSYVTLRKGESIQFA